MKRTVMSLLITSAVMLAAKAPAMAATSKDAAAHSVPPAVVTTSAPWGGANPTAVPRILYAPSECDDPAFRAQLAALIGGTVDYFDPRLATPTAAALSTYTCVFTWVNYSYADRNRFGDRLADFVDAGGRVILGPFCTYTAGSSMGGRIMTSAYSPVVSPSSGNHFSLSDYAHDGSACLFSGVSSVGSVFRDVLTLQGTGVASGHYQDGEILLAYRADFKVIYANGINGLPTITGCSYACPDLWPKLIANASSCVSAGPALATRPVGDRVPIPGTSDRLSSSARPTLDPTWWDHRSTGVPDIRSNVGSQLAALARAAGPMPRSNLGSGTPMPSENVLTPNAPTFIPRILYAPAVADDPDFRSQTAALTGGVVDYFDTRTCTPTPAQLANYDVVYTWVNDGYADPVLFGDRLADFVDGGGRVILGLYCTYTIGFSMGGRIMTSGYSPVRSPSGNSHQGPGVYGGDGGACIFGGVPLFGSPDRDILTTQGAGVVDGHYGDGEILFAYRPDFRVIYANGLGAYPTCPDQWPKLIAHASVCLSPGPALATAGEAVETAPLAGPMDALNAAGMSLTPKHASLNLGGTSAGGSTAGAPRLRQSPNVLTPNAAASTSRMLYAPSDADDPDYRAAIAAITGGIVDYYNAATCTPPASLLATYDCVYTWANASYSNRQLFGERLADYVDAGGKVILGAFCTYRSGNYLAGRIMTPAYCPVISPAGNNHFASSGYARDGSSCVYLMVEDFSSLVRDFLVTQGSGVADGHYNDGEIAVAFRPDRKVIYANGTGAASIPEGCGSGFARIIANACRCIAPGPPPARPALYGASAEGQLFTIDLATGHGNPVGSLPTFATHDGVAEIAFSRNTNRAWLQMHEGRFFDREFDINTGSGAGLQGPVGNGASFTAFEFVGNTLYGTTVPYQCGLARNLYAPSADDDPCFRAAVSGFSGARVDYYDARAGTPTPAELANYDCVYTWLSAAYADRVLFGDRLADFADAGGRVILGAFCTFTSGNSLGGRIMTAGYCPVRSPSGTNHLALSDYHSDGSTCIHTGVAAYGCTYRDVLVTQGGGVVDGHYNDGEIAQAYRPDFGVIYSNGIGAGPFSCGGPWARLIANAATCPGMVPNAQLRTLNPMTGESIVIGPTHVGPVVGLAYDRTHELMYGISGCVAPTSALVSIDLMSGAGSAIGVTGVSLASLEFGPDGKLYGGGSTLDGGHLYSINTNTGAVTLVGATGFASVAGLALVETPPLVVPPERPARGRLELAGIHPNPSPRDLNVSFSLVNGEPAIIEVMDVRGRRVLSRHVGGLGAGNHTLNLAQGAGLAPGVYVVRLSQGVESRSQKACVLR